MPRGEASSFLYLPDAEAAAAEAAAAPAPPGSQWAGGGGRSASGSSSFTSNLRGWIGMICAGLIANAHSAPIGLFMVPITASLQAASGHGSDGGGDGVGREAISLAVGISEFTNGSASILWGALEGSLGIFPTLSLGALLMIASLWLTSFAVPIYAHTDFLILYVSIPLTGLGSAACSPGILLGAVGKLFKDESMRAKAMGYTFAMSSAGGIAIPPLIAILIAACAESVHPLAFHRRAED